LSIVRASSTLLLLLPALAVACAASPPAPTTSPASPSTSTSASDSTPVAAASSAPKAKVCTEFACEDRFTIKLKQPPFDAKEWAVELEVDGKKSTCTFEWSAASKSANCSAGVTMSFHAPPIEDGVTAVVQLSGAPARIGFAVLHHGKPVEPARTYTPTYELVQPNGPDCPPSCRQASGPFVLK
jgi:hypothetical protein